ncbi:MAG TPA: DUF445 domain-containing protein [Burkholderiales bacterium]|nr:DUF445 domain-containing protein [Burkholderiales bacterium]
MPSTEQSAGRALARQSAWATGLVALCALVFVCARMFEGRYPGLAWVAAFAEAAIIGGLADWYAVVALFRHPLGLKLPHTAIIPANQARIAEQLGDFIARHFLAGERVAEKLLELDPAGIAGRWLADPANRERAVAQAGREAVRDELGLLERIEGFLAEPAAQEAIRERIRAELPSLARWFQADAYVLAKLGAAAQSLVQEMREDPVHPLRAELRGFALRSLEEFLATAAARLQEDHEFRERLNRWLAARAGALTERNRHEVAGFVAEQVKSWDAHRAVSVIEHAIGRDLQYIRVNGTLVGGLLGLVILGATRLFQA